MAILTVLAACFYVLMEWLFLVTRPSFMSPLSIFERLLVLVVSFGPVWLFLVAPLGVGGLIGMLIPSSRKSKLLLALARLIPAALLGLSFLLLVDNFSHTVLGWGIRNSQGYQLIGYQILLGGLSLTAYCQLWQAEKAIDRSARRPFVKISCAVLLCLTGVGTIYTWLLQSPALELPGASARAGNLPNILLIIGDGLAATHMSLYGYQRDTTPGLRELAPRSLIAENCFSNAGPSGASIASLLTGKLPTRTRLFYPPDILTGDDAYQHLPAILRLNGYRSANISLRHYVDAYDLNMRASFDWSNGRRLQEFELSASLTSWIGQRSSYFVTILRDRIESRLLHIFTVKKMSDAFEEVRLVEKKYTRDWERTDQLWNFIEAGPDPFFAYIHFLGTHGDTFNPPKRVFSKGQQQTEHWMTDFYDDAVLAFDQQVQDILQGLKDRGKLANTVVIIGSDHAMNHRTEDRVPLMFVFPDNSHVGRVTVNAQNLDVAPTLLDYLDIVQPEWMSGRSLISDRLEKSYVFSANRARLPAAGEGGWWQHQEMSLTPPFFSLGLLSVVDCNRVYKLDVRGLRLLVSWVEGHTQPCFPNSMLTPQEAISILNQHLRGTGYDVSTLVPPAIRVVETPARYDTLKETDPIQPKM